MKKIFMIKLSLLIIIISACSQAPIIKTEVVKSQINKEKDVESKDILINFKKSKKKEIIFGKHNIENEIMQILKTKDPEKRWITKIDNKNGYAKLEGRMEGYIEYFLFVGAKKTILAEVTWGCGPLCNQQIKFYQKLIDRYQVVSLLELVDLKYKVNLLKLGKGCFNANTFNSLNNNSCALMLELPRQGLSVAMYQATHKDNDDYVYFSEQAKNYYLGSLVWNRSVFKFVMEK